MPKCRNCGHDVAPLPSMTEVQGKQIMASIETITRSSDLHQQQVNAELLDHIRKLWDENKSLRYQREQAYKRILKLGGDLDG